MASVWAKHAVRFSRRDVIHHCWRRQLTALPFPAQSSSRNGPDRLDHCFLEDRRPVSLAESGDAKRFWLGPVVRPLPSARTRLHTPTRLGRGGTLPESWDPPPS